MIGPFPLAETILHIQQHAPLFRLVSHAADLQAAIDQAPPAFPAVYVVRQERGRPSAGASGGVLIQQVDVDLICVLYVKNVASPTSGSRVAKDMDAIAGQLRDALLNWSPAVGMEPITFNASRDQSHKNGLLIAQELYRSRYRIEVRQ